MTEIKFLSIDNPTPLITHVFLITDMAVAAGFNY
jgi:hypothetical protein